MADHTRDTDFSISVIDRIAVPIPTDRFSVRKTSAVWFEGRYYLYADVIPWDNPHHPDSYDTAIHLFSSDDAEQWRHHGEVIGKDAAGEWTASGVATPGACVFDGKVCVAYSVRGNSDGSGHRFIGVSMADHPAGPFREVSSLRIVPDDVDYAHTDPMLLLDDPCPVACNADRTGPGDERLDIFYRRSLNRNTRGPDHGTALEYDIRHRSASDSDGSWGSPHTVVTAHPGDVVETADVRWINESLVMIVLSYTQGEMAVYLSQDGTDFVPASPHLLESYLDIFMPAACFRLPGLIPDADGYVRHLTTPGDIDERGHYTQWVFRVECT